MFHHKKSSPKGQTPGIPPTTQVSDLSLRPSQVAAAHSHLSVVYRTVPQAAQAVLAGAPCAETTKNNRLLPLLLGLLSIHLTRKSQ